MPGRRLENPFVFGEIVDRGRFVNRKQELEQLMRDVADGQNVFLLSPRQFGKSSLVRMAFDRLQRRRLRTVIINVSSYASYSQFLEKYAEKVLRAAGPWDRTKKWVSRFFRLVRPEVTYNPLTGEAGLSLGRASDFDPGPIASDVFAMPGELARNGGFRMAICFDEFQQIGHFNGVSVENALRDAVQRHRNIGYVFSGSQPSLMEAILSPQRPFYKAGPRMFLDKIAAKDWKKYISTQFGRRNRQVTPAAFERLLAAADLIPYDVQRIAHELWDYAELRGKKKLESADVDEVTNRLVAGQSVFYERLWEQFSRRQRAVAQALAERGSKHIFSQAVRLEYRLGPASSVQKALQSLDSQDILGRYQKEYFFLDPLFTLWLRRQVGR